MKKKKKFEKGYILERKYERSGVKEMLCYNKNLN
jgi:hypothetical protein